MNKPRALDLFCGAGGASYGLHLAGYEVVGVDLAFQKNYPFEFHQADALTFPLDGYDLLWASPPCQKWSLGAQRWGQVERFDCLNPIREKLRKMDTPWIIENVRDAPLERAVMLCGTMFGLKLLKHRYFESNVMLFQPQHSSHIWSIKYGKGYVTTAGHGGNGSGKIKDWQDALGIDWTRDRHELAEAIPPAYSEWLGRQLLAQIELKEQAV